MNPYEAAEKIFSPENDEHLSASEQIKKYSKKMEKAGLLSSKMKSKYAKAIKEQQEVEKQAAAELMTRMLLRNCNVVDDDLYGDGDQSPLKGMEAQKLRTQWANGMDFHPNNLSTFYTACYVGDTQCVKEMLKQSNDKQKLIEKRETLLRFSALFCVVQGAKASVHAVIDNEKLNRLAVMKLLIKEGANVNARDIAGYSVLFHCFTAYGNQEEKSILGTELMSAGADVNLPNRFGCTPLHENVMTQNFELLDFLVEHGADPSIKDNDGIAPNSLVALFPAAQKIFSKAGFISGSEKREEAKSTGELGKCSNCDKAGAKKRCSKCLIAYYCNRDCQRGHWKKHKKECGEKEKLKVKVDTTVPSKDGKNLSYASINLKDLKSYTSEMESKPTKPYFKVKVQVPITNILDTEKSFLLVYDKKRSFQRFIQPSDPSYDSIVEKIRMDGVMQCKAYFYASLDENDELSIQLDNMLPPESW